MRAPLAGCALLLLAAACAEPGEAVRADDGVVRRWAADAAAEPLEPLRVVEDSTATALRVDTVASGLEVPWAFDFAPDGRIFLTERVGRVRVVENGVLRAEPWAEFGVHARDAEWRPESGLMGIALAPDFARTGHVYVVGTFRRDEGPLGRVWRAVASRVSSAPVSPWENRVYRLTDRGGRGVERTLVVGGLPAWHYHAGSALAFGPDGMLYVTTGDVTRSPEAQDGESLAGKVLRYRPDGSVPADNPVPGSPVYAAGFRNSQGLAWHPETGELFAAEHGPTAMAHEGARWGHDEVNVVARGANYGWPVVAGRQAHPGFTPPAMEWSSGMAPSGIAVYTGPHAAWRGNLFVGGLRGRQLGRVVVERDARGTPRAVRQQSLLRDQVGRIRGVRMGPDGALYVTTSNRDGRGTPRPGDDHLLRVSPVR